MSDEVRSYKMQARLPAAPRSPLKAPSTHTIRVAKRSVPRESVVDGKAVMRPPSLGKIIERRKADPESGEIKVINRYRQTSFLGKGGFAKVYSVVDMDTQEILAAKVIAKSSLTKRRTKEKLATEIRIHAMLKHKHIVKYLNFFEDSTNCYIMMELCTNKSLADLIKARKRLTEAEVKYYMMQLLEAISYMHSRRVIHRDLKLGNIFLNSELHLKIGDFGLATRLQHDNDRRRTLCGTPNYIAPEILERGDNGHSYEADIWSAGVILYTLLIGKPPFETNNVQSTYKRIKENDYVFPENIEIPIAAKRLIRRILNSDPEQRPTVQEIMNDPFFTEGHIPRSLPLSSLNSIPTFSPSCSTIASDAPAAATMRQPLIDTTNTLGLPVATNTKEKDNVDDIIAEAKALIAGASKPVAAPTVAVKAALPPSTTTSCSTTTTSPSDDLAAIFHKQRSPTLDAEPSNGQNNENVMPCDGVLTRKRLRSPFRNGGLALTSPTKQRPRKSGMMSSCKRLIDEFEEKESKNHMMEEEERLQKEMVSEQEHRPAAPEPKKPVEEPPAAEEEHVSTKVAIFVAVHRTLTESFSRLALSDQPESAMDLASSKMPTTDTFSMVPDELRGPDALGRPTSWVRKYIDITDRYGVTYQMQDGSIGAYFNDNTTILQRCIEMNENEWKMESYFTYIYYRMDPTRGKLRWCMEQHPLETFPEELKKKAYLLKYFRKLFEKHYSKTATIVETPIPRSALSTRSVLLHVDKFYRTKRAAVFRLSNRLVQITFPDDSKVLLSQDANVVTYLDKTGNMYTNTLSATVQLASKSVVTRLQYTRDILGMIIKENSSDRHRS